MLRYHSLVFCLSDFTLAPGTHPFQELCEFYRLQEIELVISLDTFILFAGKIIFPWNK